MDDGSGVKMTQRLKRVMPALAIGFALTLLIAFIWDAKFGMRMLPMDGAPAPYTWLRAQAISGNGQDLLGPIAILPFDMNDDGTVIIGRAGSFFDGFLGAMWIEDLGWLNLRDFFYKQGVTEAFNFPMNNPGSISGSGREMECICHFQISINMGDHISMTCRQKKTNIGYFCILSTDCLLWLAVIITRKAMAGEFCLILVRSAMI